MENLYEMIPSTGQLNGMKGGRGGVSREEKGKAYLTERRRLSQNSVALCQMEQRGEDEMKKKEMMTRVEGEKERKNQGWDNIFYMEGTTTSLLPTGGRKEKGEGRGYGKE